MPAQNIATGDMAATSPAKAPMNSKTSLRSPVEATMPARIDTTIPVIHSERSWYLIDWIAFFMCYHPEYHPCVRRRAQVRGVETPGGLPPH